VNHGDTILKVNNLHTWFYTDDGVVKGCNGVSFDLKRGETLAVVGESGSGKSVTAMSILKLIPSPPGKIVKGEVNFQGQDLTTLNNAAMRQIRGNRIAMIFQEPMTSLNPVFRVGDQIMESLYLHQDGITHKKARAKALELFKLVGIPSPDSRLNNYPFEMSGGMRQRALIAMALACNPDILIADEPVSALDVTIQAQILWLMRKLQKELGMSVIMITHNLGVVAETADRVAVMYAGQIVEMGEVDDIFHDSKHPYLMGLKECVPSLSGDSSQDLYTIEGMIPHPLNLPPGCKFEPRCGQALPKCKIEEPSRFDFGNGHHTHCWLYEESGTRP
jgi:peptide/nickel transport system ATP-binding protein/oligopeptide transport system ATP-binding protein